MSDLAERISSLSPEKRALLEQQLMRRRVPAPRERAIPRRESGEHWPLSFAQERLWFLDQLLPGSPVYNVPIAVQLIGSLDLPALVRSINEIVRRHEALRTSFPLNERTPVQVIAPTTEVTVPLVDLRELPEAERETEAERLLTAEVCRPFDLARGPLVRAHLIRLSDQEHRLLLCLHHIVSDGWSMGVLFRELGALYQAFSSGQPSPLAELPIQYADFAQWQREFLQGDLLEAQRSYWKRQLAGAPGVLELPTDRPRLPIQSWRGSRQSMVLPPSLMKGLQALSLEEGVTPFMTLLAAFQTLLYRYTGAEDLVVGTPIANRSRAEIEGLIGFFVNTLALRTDLSGDPTFRELIRRVREVALGAYAHQDLPFEKLVEELQPDRDPSHSPVFQVMFVFQNTQSQPLALLGLTLQPLEVRSGTAKFDLTLSLAERAEGMTASIEYSTDLFDDDSIGRMLGHFRMLLQGVVSDPGERISRFPLLSPRERYQILEEWGQNRSDYPRERCVHELFEAQAAETPDAPAVSFEGVTLTYRQLDQRADQLAHGLRQRGIGPEALVGLCVERSLEMIVALVAILKAGGAYLPLDPGDPAERLAFLLGDARSPLLLTQRRLQDRLPDLTIPILYLEEGESGEWSVVSGEPMDGPITTDHSPLTTPESLAYVAYTSGSTGQPKGVAIPHRAVVRLVKGTDYARLSAEETFLQLAPLAFDAATFEIWGCLLNGGRLVVAPPRALSLSELASLLQRERVTTLWLTAGLFHPMVEQQLEGLRGLRQLLAGGDVLSVPHVRKVLQELPGCQMINGYGPTENTTFTCCYSVPADWPGGGSVPIGRPIANSRVYVLDAQMQPTPVGVAGELFVGGDGLARGYLDRPKLTEERFIPDPFDDSPGARLYRTGDRVKWRSDGTIEFLGRLDDQVKLRGYRIELGEIETCLGQHEQVEEVVVVARDEAPGEKRLVAYVVPQVGIAPPVNELRRYLQERLPRYMIPSAFVLLSALPLSPNGKVDRRQLPTPIATRPVGEPDPVMPRTPVEQAVAEIWSELLGIAAVGLHDNFFDLGGHSLMATLVLSRVRELFRVEVPLHALFSSPTVAGLAECVEAARREGSTLAPSLFRAASREAALPLSFAQQRLWFLDQFQPESPTYNIPLALHLQGPLHATALEQSLQEIVRRHEALRTTFAELDGNPIQVIHPDVSVTLPLVDLAGARGEQPSPTAKTPDSAVQTELQRRIDAEAQRPFDLAAGPLFRALLFRLAPEEHVLLLCMHHIVADGWSLGVLYRELEKLYVAFKDGQPSPLAPLRVQYADFSCWQRQWLQGETLAAHVAYWKQQLAGSLPGLSLPTDRPRPPVQSGRGASESFTLPLPMVEPLRALCQREGVTLFMALLAAFQALLGRHSGHTDLLVGTPIANRNRLETEGLIGFFVNMLVLRGNLGGDPTFRELLGRARETALGAFLHQDLPFEKLVEELQPRRNLSHTPLFQALFALQNAPAQLPELPGLCVRRREIAHSSAKFDISLEIRDHETELAGEFSYSTDLFEAATIRRLADDYRLLLERAIADPDQSIARLTLGEEAASAHRDASADEPAAPSLWQSTEQPHDFVAPRDHWERQLARLWEEVLGVMPVGVRDDFFDLGGHSLLAVRLFARIEAVFGCALPLSTLFQQPTVEQLASLLRQEDASPTWRPLVAIQPQGTRPPLFCVHAVGGNVLGYRDLARHLGLDQPVYGLQARGLDGSAVGPLPIEAIAADYLREIRSLRPTGPYCLAGSSFGGTVAFEMARQLQLQGDQVALVALFDSHAPAPGEALGLLRRVPGHLEALRRLGAHEKLVYLLARAKGVRKRLRRARWRLAYRLRTRGGQPLPGALQDVYLMNLQALQEYVPQPYPGRVTLFRAMVQSIESHPDPEMGWGELAQGGLEIYDVPGDHVSLLVEPNVRVVAEQLTTYLQRIGSAAAALK